jgi:hypothetical protein
METKSRGQFIKDKIIQKYYDDMYECINKKETDDEFDYVSDTELNRNLNDSSDDDTVDSEKEETTRDRAIKDKSQKIIIKTYYSDQSKNEKLVKKYRDLAKEDIIYKIINNLARRATKELKKKKIKRKLSHSKLIGCSASELKEHLEKLFKKKMSYDNYGKWEVDHKIPISSFNFENENEVEECFHYTNLQPLWQKENRKKGNKIIEN